MSRTGCVAALARRRPQAGQGLVECLVFALALLPLLLGMVFVTKYQNVRQAAIAASRSAAFDCTVRPEGCGSDTDVDASTAEARQRHLADPQTDLQSTGVAAPTAHESHPFWVDRRATPLIDGPASTRVVVTREAADTTSRSDTAAFGLPRHFGLRVGDDLVRADVMVQVSAGWRLADWLQQPRGMALDLAGRTAILVDPWNASEGQGTDPRSVRSRVARGAVPPVPGFEVAVDAGYLPIRSLIRSPILAPFEPNGRAFRYHDVDVEQIPADRLPATAP